MILFENNLILSKEKIMEISTIYRSAKKYKVILLAGIICFLGGLLSLWWKLSVWYSIAAFGLFLYYIYMYFKSPHKEAMILYERAKLLNNKEAEFIFTFFENKYVQYNMVTGGMVEYKYEDIIKIKQTRNLYVFFIKENIFVILDKNGFKENTVNDFDLFIRNKLIMLVKNR